MYDRSNFVVCGMLRQQSINFYVISPNHTHKQPSINSERLIKVAVSRNLLTQKPSYANNSHNIYLFIDRKIIILETGFC